MLHVAYFIFNYLYVLHTGMLWCSVFIFTWYILCPVVVFDLNIISTNTNTHADIKAILHLLEVVRHSGSFWPLCQVMYQVMTILWV